MRGPVNGAFATNGHVPRRDPRPARSTAFLATFAMTAAALTAGSFNRVDAKDELRATGTNRTRSQQAGAKKLLTPESPLGRQAAPPPPAPASAKRPAATPPPPQPSAPATVPGTATEPRRVLVQDPDGRRKVARVYGGDGSDVVLMPSGELGWPEGMAYTNDPFRPATADELETELHAGPLKSFQVRRSQHYIIFYEGTRAFADASGNLLESLYHGLTTKLKEKGLDVHEAEFPLVAVIYRSEREFRASHKVDPDIQAFYHVISNRILFYEHSDRDRTAPEVAALRKPQTVAHEGTHQILQNIGVHPRLAPWPLWLVEGLAEYCAPTTTTRGGGWGGFNKVNPFHMATLHDINDPLTLQLEGRAAGRPRRGRPGQPDAIQPILTQDQFSTTDYAKAWALTYYLANKKFDAFLAYLKEMGRMSPLAKPSPEENLATFRKFFGSDLDGMGRVVHRYLTGLKNYEPIAYYAVTFEQNDGRGMFHRAAMVSQSPAMIYRWVQDMTSPRGTPPIWNAVPFPTKARATVAATEWLEGH